ncbi:unnamed protein product [Chrysodeixis includens]|uniref:Uncharacterized protein n=1 Tax=Chrysodeixis includens TaxID=689277 RepID=A0A9P0H116_CHRIL|nr:unnamed protein product [Chrysodeixis includens]
MKGFPLTHPSAGGEDGNGGEADLPLLRGIVVGPPPGGFVTRTFEEESAKNSRQSCPSGPTKTYNPGGTNPGGEFLCVRVQVTRSRTATQTTNTNRMKQEGLGGEAISGSTRKPPQADWTGPVQLTGPV